MNPADPLARLSSLAHEHPALSEVAAIHRAFLPLLEEAEGRFPALALEEGEARSRLAEGTPLLAGVELPLDPGEVTRLFLALARAVEAAAGDGQASAGAVLLRAAVEEGRLDPGDLLAHAASGDPGAAGGAASRAGVDPRLAWMVAVYALKPALRRWSRQVAPLLEGADWERSSCPVCGAFPALGELRGPSRAKRLRCGRCGADWAFPRVKCAWCGSEDPASLKVLFEEGMREVRWVEACDGCRGYLKVVSAWSPTAPAMLAVEDLSTLPLDAIARKAGYRPGAEKA